ncbi:CBS domain-containing protein [Candidatus Micrarchaeota archaeon]|nr:CBS domain-containing protein [Candidatus Micrarchaeota archaeon]
MGKKYVKDIMAENVLMINENAAIAEAVKLMHEKKVSSLIVNCSGDKPFGIVTRKDIIKALLVNGTKPGQAVSRIMSSPLIIATPNLRIKDAAALTERFKIRRLPIIAHGKLVGIVSTSDIFRHLAERMLKQTKKGKP